MSFEKIAEEKIQDAIAAGEFDNLPGKGEATREGGKSLFYCRASVSEAV